MLGRRVCSGVGWLRGYSTLRLPKTLRVKYSVSLPRGEETEAHVVQLQAQGHAAS